MQSLSLDNLNILFHDRKNICLLEHDKFLYAWPSCLFLKFAEKRVQSWLVLLPSLSLSSSMSLLVPSRIGPLCLIIFNITFLSGYAPASSFSTCSVSIVSKFTNKIWGYLNQNSDLHFHKTRTLLRVLWKCKSEFWFK